MNCAEHFVRHKPGNPKCPLCRTPWGDNALKDLRAETRIFNENRKEKEQ